MSDYEGIVIAESLEDDAVLGQLSIIETRVDAVEERHCTPWLRPWTFLTVAVPEDDAQTIAGELSQAIEKERAGSWYADFKNATHHYVIFRDKVFFIDRRSSSQYEEANAYARRIGIPEAQIDFASPLEG